MTKSLPINQISKPPNDRKGAKGITCLNLTKFKGKPTKQYIAAKIYEMPTANNVPIGPSQRESIATNFESPLPIASFLKIYLAKYLRISKTKNDIADELSPLANKQKSINLLLNKPTKIKHTKPEINPKLIKP